MNIVIIGSGNVATILGKKFIAAGHSILQVAGRNKTDVQNLASIWKTDCIDFSGELNPHAEVYIIAASDDAIKDVIAGIRIKDSVIAHTAASVSIDILKPVSEHYGVFYPLQSLRKEMAVLPEIPILYDGNDEKAKMKLESLASSVSPGYVSFAGDELRSKIHLAAVFVNNFTNHLYTLAKKISDAEGFNFKILQPLIEETANRLKDISPENAQTGPAIRNDDETIRKQLAMLAADPHLKKIYESLTESIRSFKLK